MPSQDIADTLDTIITAIEANDFETATEAADRLVTLYERSEAAEARGFSKAAKAKEPGSLTNPFESSTDASDAASGATTTSSTTDGFGASTTEPSETATGETATAETATDDEVAEDANATLATYAATSAAVEPLRGIALFQFAFAIESQNEKLFDALVPHLRKLRSLERQYLEQEAGVEDELASVSLPADVEIMGVETPPQSLPVPSDVTATVIVRNVGEQESAPATLEVSTGPGLQLDTDQRSIPALSPDERARIELPLRLTKQNPHQLKASIRRDGELLATGTGFVIGRVPPEERVEYDAESISREDVTSPNSTVDKVGVGLGLFGLLGGGGAVGYAMTNRNADTGTGRETDTEKDIDTATDTEAGGEMDTENDPTDSEDESNDRMSE